ncbi:MAG: EAL domain-containing protein, partial [Erysipelotrichaceae bacterium]|nr:EAL domain-containing protein [Erysipelotrichaceae bacterium]
RIFLTIIGLLITASLVNIFYHVLLAGRNPDTYNLIYILRLTYHAILFDVLFLFTLYATVASGMEHSKARMIAIISSALFALVVIIDIVQSYNGVGFRILEDGTVIDDSRIFMIGYVLFMIMLIGILSRIRDMLYKRVMYGFYGTMAVSIFIRFLQLIFNQTSLTTITFVFPVIAMMYIMHSNPYNITLGAVDIRAMEDLINNMYSRKERFIFLSLFLPEYNEENRQLPVEIGPFVREVASDFFRKSVLFQIDDGHIILLVSKQYNPDYEKKIDMVLEKFREQHERFHFDYKIVIGDDIEEISRKNEYVNLIRDIQKNLEENTIHRVNEEDIARFNRNDYILKQLIDIYNKDDIDDPRVLVFTQPVYNLKNGEFDTAEALMRLDLKDLGIIYPDQFIPVAESHGYIHSLTRIILNKTCRQIKQLSKEGFRISRISVNISALELKDSGFCDDVNQIIEDNDISGDKIAIELTESRSDADFMIMKEKIDELRNKGIRFYLDDFGTGYSNMERIMELPFDIIKFDRSLVIASGSDERSEKNVENLAHLLKDMKYAILYEGVENDHDEKRCTQM